MVVATIKWVRKSVIIFNGGNDAKLTLITFSQRIWYLRPTWARLLNLVQAEFRIWTWFQITDILFEQWSQLNTIYVGYTKYCAIFTTIFYYKPSLQIFVLCRRQRCNNICADYPRTHRSGCITYISLFTPAQRTERIFSCSGQRKLRLAWFYVSELSARSRPLELGSNKSGDRLQFRFHVIPFVLRLQSP